MEERPNIILILSDQFRGDSLSCLGHPVAETPNLDQLAGEGVHFSRAYSPCPSCVPARRSLMTGLTPYSAGMVGYQDFEPWDYEHTLAGELTKAGYQSINIGRTHFHPQRLHLGFEQLILNKEEYESWLREQGVEGGKFVHGVDNNSWIGRPNHLPEYLMEESWLVNHAEAFLAKRDPTRPFFMCLSLTGPHPPWCPPEYFFHLFNAKDIPPPAVGDWVEADACEAALFDVNAWRQKLPPHWTHRAQAAYHAYIAYVDSQIGRFMRTLRRRELASNSWILFASDHGEMLGDHHLWRKTYAYEGSSRIPLILCPPMSENRIPRKPCRELVGLEDVMPTLLEIGDAPDPGSLEGKSLLKLLRGEVAPRPYYHGEHAPRYDSECAHQFLTDYRWKYIWNPTNGREQLFDLAEDPSECNDLAESEDFQDVLKTWRLKLVQELKDRPEGFSDGTKLYKVTPSAVVDQSIRQE